MARKICDGKKALRSLENLKGTTITTPNKNALDEFNKYSKRNYGIKEEIPYKIIN